MCGVGGADPSRPGGPGHLRISDDKESESVMTREANQ
jgi:hypothetical protein